MTFETLLLQAGGGGDLRTTMLMLGLMFVVFWFFLIRPQSKKQKEQRLFLEDLQKGDEVVTSSGIIGRINKIEENNIINLEVGNKMYIRVTKNAISKEMTEAVYAAETKDKKQTS